MSNFSRFKKGFSLIYRCKIPLAFHPFFLLIALIGTISLSFFTLLTLTYDQYFIVYLAILLFFLFICLEIIFNAEIRRTYQILQYGATTYINTLLYIFVYTCTVVFFLFTLSLLNIVGILNIDLNYLSNNVDFSNFAQISSGIIVLIITLTLVIVQIIAQRYSARITEIFKKYPDLWILLLYYVMSIIYYIFVSSIELENFRYFGAIFIITSLIFIFPYLWNLMNILRPENAIAWCAHRLTPDYDWSDENYLQSIFDIMYMSIEIGDLKTFDVGQKTLRDSNYGIIQILSMVVIDPENHVIDENKTHQKFLKIVKSVRYIEQNALHKEFLDERENILDFLSEIINAQNEGIISSLMGIYHYDPDNRFREYSQNLLL